MGQMVSIQLHLLGGGVQAGLRHGLGRLRQQGLERGEVLRLVRGHVARLPRAAVSAGTAWEEIILINYSLI